MVPDGSSGRIGMACVELHIQLGPHEAAVAEPQVRLANDNTERDQELFEQSVERELTDDEA